MPVQYIKGDEVTDQTKEGTVIVGAFAPWCGPCKILSPFLEEISNEGIKVVKVDVDESKEWAAAQGIHGIPATFIYKNGQLKQTLNGFTPKEVIVAAANNA